MSMTQEEIEALMNETADIAVPETEEVVEEDNTEMSVDDISTLVESSEEKEEDDFDDVLSGIEGITEDEPEIAQDNDITPDMDDILSGIEGITEDEPVIEKTPEAIEVTEDVSAVLNNQIDQGIYPLPVEKEHKVVNQLNEVAEDSEEKGAKIFDVLSLVLDENANIEKNVKELGSFVEKQIVLLEALSSKFPNVAVLGENLELAKTLASIPADTCDKINEENNQIFVAMELMQFNDINRQKIERVMAVIKKLSQYLNGLFEDDSDKPEVQIARHISGDSANTVNEEDIESLIADFSNN